MEVDALNDSCDVSIGVQFFARRMTDGCADHGFHRARYEGKDTRAAYIVVGNSREHQYAADNPRIPSTCVHARVVFDPRGAARHQSHCRRSPVRLERVIEGNRSYLFFPGIEADCGTEPIDSNDFERSSIAKKFAAYLGRCRAEIGRAHV